MCVTSMIGDAWGKTVPPWTQPYTNPNPIYPVPPIDTVSREEVEALRKEIQELKKLLIAAKAFDAATGQPECETDEKVALLKRLADLVGVDLEDVLAV